MKPRDIAAGVTRLGVIDWDAELFDAFVPLPEGTSYNCYLVRGNAKTALVDTVEEEHAAVLFAQLAGLERLDYVISLHAEQDHSGSIPQVLARFPEARLVGSKKSLNVLAGHLDISRDRLDRVGEGDSLDLGGRTLRFLDTPWVHWPETMSAWLEEDRILFPCDLFGSHLACSDLYADDRARVYREAKLYYAHIMMPFRAQVARHLEKVRALNPAQIAPSHGPVYREPGFIVAAYDDWAVQPPRNLAMVPFVSMHGSVRRMVDRLVDGLVDHGLRVERLDLSSSDPGVLASALVDAATIVLGAPAVLDAPHPLAAGAAYTINLLKPKARFVSCLGSYGWTKTAVDPLLAMLPNLSAEVIPPVIARGRPTEADLAAVDALASTIAERHAAAGLK